MARRVFVKGNDAEISALLRSPGVVGLVNDIAVQIMMRTPLKYQYEVAYGTGSDRHRAFVVTGDFRAMRDNARNATLLRALGGG